MESLEHTIIWQRLDAPGHDTCGLWSIAGGWRLEGTASFVHDGVPCHLAYVADCDDEWHALAALVVGWIGSREVEAAIRPTPRDGWQLNGREQTTARGLLDIDLGFTPATNLIQLRRLALPVGGATDAPAVYLRFPDMELDRLEQHYARVAANEYDYAAPETGYSGRLEVHDNGFVTAYPGIWQMEAIR
jgi:hypothetical protein